MPEIFTRVRWGAREPKRTPVRMNPANVTHTFIHYTAGPTTQKVRDIQRFHQDTRGWNDIAYNYLVDQQGNIYEGRGWFIVGGHTNGWNSKSHAICWIGGPGDVPTDEALKSINHLIQEIHDRLGRETIVAPHSSVVSTSCPGDLLRAWIAKGRPIQDVPSQGDTDMRLINVTSGPDKGKWFLVSGDVRQYISDPAVLAEFQKAGIPAAGLSDPAWQMVVNATALDAVGLRSMPPVQYQTLVNIIQGAVHGDLSEEEIKRAVKAALREGTA